MNENGQKSRKDNYDGSDDARSLHTAGQLRPVVKIWQKEKHY